MTSTPLLLIPGYMLDQTLWDDVLPALEALGPIQHGSLDYADTIPGIARRTVALAPPEFYVVGFSMGGYVAREVVRLAPGRVKGLILIATSSGPDSPVKREQRAMAARNTPEGPFRGLARGALISSLHPQHAGNEPLIARLREMGARLGRQAFIGQSMLTRVSDTAQLGDIACPTLVVAGAQDQLRNVEEARVLAAGIPGATLEVIEDCGHMIPLEQPAQLAGAITRWFVKLEL